MYSFLIILINIIFFRETAVVHPKLTKAPKLDLNLGRKYGDLARSHLPVSLLPTSIWGYSKPKIIYIARNPKNMVVDYYDYYVQMHGYQGNLDEFVDLLINDSVMYAPFHSHITEFWAMRNENNIMFATYEADIEDDLFGFIQRIADFIGVEVTEDQLSGLVVNGLHFLNAPFYSKSEVENMDKLWNRKPELSSSSQPTVLSDELIRKIDEWNTNNLLNCDFKFSK